MMRLPAISMTRLVPLNARFIFKDPDPLSVRLLPEPMELGVSSIVRVLLLPEAVNVTTAELEMVRVLIVKVGVLRSMVALISITTSCALVGTRLRDQLEAVPQLLSVEPSQVFVWAWTWVQPRQMVSRKA